MKGRWILVMSIVAFIIYAAFGIRGWLGVEEINRNNQDSTYFAAVYSHSRLLIPFMKTQDVLVPSASDLNSHTVFETYGFRQTIDIQWLDPANLQITCRNCSGNTLWSNKVDEINIHLKKQ